LQGSALIAGANSGPNGPNDGCQAAKVKTNPPADFALCRIHGGCVNIFDWEPLPKLRRSTPCKEPTATECCREDRGTLQGESEEKGHAGKMPQSFTIGTLKGDLWIPLDRLRARLDKRVSEYSTNWEPDRN
jgi:hypothetical protein